MIDPPTQGADTDPSLVSARYSEWSTPVNLGSTINSTSSDQGPYVSKDALSLYFVSQRTGGFGANDIYVSTREHEDDLWGPGQNLGATINTTGTESTPALSRDEKLLYFATNLGGTSPSGLDIWTAARHNRQDPLAWDNLVKLGSGVNSASNDLGPAPFYDNKAKTLTLYFYSVRPGGSGCRDMYSSTRSENGEFTTAVPLAELNTSFEDEQPAIRRDGLEMFFVSNRHDPGIGCLGPGALGTSDIYVSTRASTSDRWGPPANLGTTINTAGAEGRPAISFDGTKLYFFSDGYGGSGGTDLFVSTRTELDDGGDE
jgi:Tol biopolymer transport system component